MLLHHSSQFELQGRGRGRGEWKREPSFSFDLNGPYSLQTRLDMEAIGDTGLQTPTQRVCGLPVSRRFSHAKSLSGALLPESIYCQLPVLPAGYHDCCRTYFVSKCAASANKFWRW